MLKGVILSEIDSRNGPIKLEYFVTPCSKYIYIYMYIYMWPYVNLYAHGRWYVMRAELVACHFSNVPAVLNVVTNGNGTGTKNVLKWNRALEFEFSIQCSIYSATTVAKVSLFSTWTRCTVSFYSM